MDKSNAGAQSLTDLDIDSHEDVQSGKIFLKDPSTGSPTATYVEFAGPEHPQRKKRVMDAQRRMRAHLQKTGKLQLRDPIEDDEDNLDLLVECALSWNVKRGGVVIPFSSAAVRDLLSDPKKRWLRDQLQAGFDERENFIVRSAAS